MRKPFAVVSSKGAWAMIFHTALGLSGSSDHKEIVRPLAYSHSGEPNPCDIVRVVGSPRILSTSPGVISSATPPSCSTRVRCDFVGVVEMEAWGSGVAIFVGMEADWLEGRVIGPVDSVTLAGGVSCCWSSDDGRPVDAGLPHALSITNKAMPAIAGRKTRSIHWMLTQGDARICSLSVVILAKTRVRIDCVID